MKGTCILICYSINHEVTCWLRLRLGTALLVYSLYSNLVLNHSKINILLLVEKTIKIWKAKKPLSIKRQKIFAATALQNIEKYHISKTTSIYQKVR